MDFTAVDFVVVTSVTTNTQRISKKFFGLYLKMFIYLYPNFQMETWHLDWMIDVKKLVLSICPLLLNLKNPRFSKI